MSVFNEHTSVGMPQTDAVQRILEAYGARRERARSLLARQSELLARLQQAAPLSAATSSADANLFSAVQELLQRQELWQQRHREDLQRHELLLDAVSEQLEELSAQMSPSERRTVSSRPAPAAPPSTPPTNWEQAKQRLLQELENGDDPSTEPVVEETPVVARSSRRDLEQLVTQKDAEIAELRRQLAAGPARSAESALLDADEVVQRERAHLRRLQEEWQEKLKKAEIDISIERAKLARERTQLDERLQSAQRDGTDSTSAGSDPTGKAHRNRWLSRLGLLEE
jgi:hypothetical protein